MSTTLRINAFFGFAKPLPENENTPIVITADPFRGTKDGLVPSFLEDPLSRPIIEGVNIDRGNGNHHVTGEQISRGIAFHALLEKIDGLVAVNEKLEDGDMVVNISRCGNLGNYAMRYLIGMPGVEVKFHGYNPDWKAALEKLEPLTVRTKVINPRKALEEQKARAEAEVVELEKKGIITSAPIADAEEDDNSYQLNEVKPVAKKPVKKAVKKTVVVTEEAEAPVTKTVKKVAKKAVEVEEVAEAPVKKPVKKAPAKKAVAASEESLAALSEKFPAKATKTAKK